MKALARKYKLRILTALLVPVCIVLQSSGPGSTADENAVKAMFIYNFTKYFDWSSYASQPEFRIDVYGNTPVTAFLDEIAKRKTVDNKPIRIRIISNLEDAAGSQMLYLPGNNASQLSASQRSKLGPSIIIISEGTGTAKRIAHINLMNIEGKLRFELNESILRKQDIKYSRELPALSSRIY